MVSQAVAPGAPAVPGVLGEKDDAAEYMGPEFDENGQNAAHPAGDKGQPSVAHHRQQHQGDPGPAGDGRAGGQGDHDGAQDQGQGTGQAAHGQILGVQLQTPAQPDRHRQVGHGEHSHKDRRGHPTNAPFRANMWFMGPEPWPRSSMAASAPEMYSLARSTDSSRS